MMTPASAREDFPVPNRLVWIVHFLQFYILHFILSVCLFIVLFAFEKAGVWRTFTIHVDSVCRASLKVCTISFTENAL